MREALSANFSEILTGVVEPNFRCALGIAWLVALVTAGVVGCVLTARAAPPVPARGEWPTYGGTHANARYSSLAQITRDNAHYLRIAWRWVSPDRELMASQPGIQTWANEATPLMVGGVLYVSTSASQVAAIDARTGRTLWVHDPKIWVHGTPANFGYVHRGVAYWADGRDPRVFIGTGNGYLLSLDARTGMPIASFGQDGRVDLVTTNWPRGVSILLNRGGGTFGPRHVFVPHRRAFSVAVGDVNGDGRLDVLTQAGYAAPLPPLLVLLNST